MESENITYHCW